MNVLVAFLKSLRNGSGKERLFDKYTNSKILRRQLRWRNTSDFGESLTIIVYVISECEETFCFRLEMCMRAPRIKLL